MANGGPRSTTTPNLVEIGLRRRGISGKTGASTRPPETDESVSAGRRLPERVTKLATAGWLENREIPLQA